MPIFTTTTGTPIEPKTFSKHWYDALRACGIRQRGLYTTKDTFVHVALKAGVRIAWLEQQTGVAYATLLKHYGGWMTSGGPREVERFAALEPSLFSLPTPPRCPRGQGGPGTTARKRSEVAGREKCEEGDLNHTRTSKSQGISRGNILRNPHLPPRIVPSGHNPNGGDERQAGP